ncbi:MAG TPA: ArsI/CadI family heavy metal resistance metalloenzyme [Candidatus Binatia bacterium]|nr:ArsI/CadI family heavy metal resistance metalloenzyme [Candidatus Binatia bacterium]
MSQRAFHVSLYVTDIPAAVERYRRILGVEPAKVRPEYAKFELADPPAVVSLNLGGAPGTVGHLGIRHPGTADVATELVRVRREGLEALTQSGVTCCYATSDKFWVRDADGMRWEVYANTGDADAYVLPNAEPETKCCAASG